jgi:hypothetical protein
MSFASDTLRHFQLRLKRFYARLCHNPWRKNILYLGDPAYLPNVSSDKHVYWGTTIEGSTHSRAFPLWLSTYDELPFADGSIDVVICHFSEPLECSSFLQECYRVLASEGKCLWTISNPYSLYYSCCPKEREQFSIFEARRRLCEYEFDVLSVQSHSFLPAVHLRWLFGISLRWERWLVKYFPFFANKVSFVAIKKTNHYSPLPSYLRLSHRVL